MAGGNLFALLLMTGMAAMVLGLGVSTTPTYIIVVILLAPALIQAGMIPSVLTCLYSTMRCWVS